MIGVPTKPCPAPLELPQMPFGTLRALLLQCADVLEVAPFDRLPALLAQEVVVRGDRRVIQAQIDTDHLIGRLHLGRRNGDNDV